MRGPIELLRFWMLRKLERRLPPDVLYRTLRPVASVRAALRLPFHRRRPPLPLPGCFGPDRQVPMGKLRRRTHYLNQALEFFPDRLAAPEWNSRCRINGLEQVRQARRRGKPVLLAFCHFGPYVLLRFWLRAGGIPAAALVQGNRASRPMVRRLTDRLSPFPDVPTAIYQDDLPRVIQFIKSGHPLLMALDRDTGKQIEVPVQEGWSFRMATGAIRLAASHEAELIPCAIIDEGGWHFRIELGRPVPRELLTGPHAWLPAGKHLLDHLFPHLRSHPEQGPALLGRFRPDAGTPNPHFQHP
jgi:lauroyl/myristoyl acyltransferase